MGVLGFVIGVAVGVGVAGWGAARGDSPISPPEVVLSAAGVAGDVEQYLLYGDEGTQVWRVRQRTLGPHVLMPGESSGAVVVADAGTPLATFASERVRELYEPRVYPLGDGAALLLRYEIHEDAPSVATVHHIRSGGVVQAWTETFAVLAQGDGEITATRFALTNGLDGTPMIVRLSEKWTKRDGPNWRLAVEGEPVAVWHEEGCRFRPLQHER